jgi:phosphoglycolate phosphatase-like HAD superfamily hydrolase
VPQTILFDLDETLIDRTPSIVHYAARFQRDFTDAFRQRPLPSPRRFWPLTSGATVRVTLCLRTLSSVCRGGRLLWSDVSRRIGRRGSRGRLSPVRD